MTTIEIFERGITRTIPSSWEEMTDKQVCFVIKTHDECIRKRLSPLAFSVRVLYHLLGIRYDWRNMLWEVMHPKKAELRNANIYMLCDKCLGFLFAEDSMQLAFSRTDNPLPIARAGRFSKQLIGPANMLQNLSFGEFRHAATAMNAFFKSKRIEDLDESIAFLYRVRANRPNRCGRQVATIDNNTFGRDVRRVARLPLWQKNLIMLWFASCLNYLQTGTIIIDGEEIDMSRLFSSGDEHSSESAAFAWNDLLIQIAREQTIGNIERVDEEPLFTILHLLWHNHKEHKRNEKIGKTY